uniref:Uncharacterized protein n=1 Tax=Knipowitschia caucasica TaxID=637954 RepID=A0AAV2J3V3_KNICA
MLLQMAHSWFLDQHFTHREVRLNCLPLDRLPLDRLPLDRLPLDRLPLDRLPLDCLPLDGLPLAGLPLDCLPLDCLPLAGLRRTVSPLASPPLDCLPLAGLPLDCLPLDCLPLGCSLPLILILWLCSSSITCTVLLQAAPTCQPPLPDSPPPRHTLHKPQNAPRLLVKKSETKGAGCKTSQRTPPAADKHGNKKVGREMCFPSR